MYQQKRENSSGKLSLFDHAKESVPLNFTAGNFIRLWHNEALKMNITNYIYTSIYILMNKKKNMSKIMAEQ